MPPNPVVEGTGASDRAGETGPHYAQRRLPNANYLVTDEVCIDHTGAPETNVPFVESRSVNLSPLSVTSRAAWRRETLESVSLTSRPAALTDEQRRSALAIERSAETRLGPSTTSMRNAAGAAG